MRKHSGRREGEKEEKRKKIREACTKADKQNEVKKIKEGIKPNNRNSQEGSKPNNKKSQRGEQSKQRKESKKGAN